MLRKLEGWDAFNVTEDCDLGMRLAKRGYRTAIIDSTTHEEANSGYFNWYSQRSRWIKGYIQTYFVHMRNPQNYFKEGRAKDFFLFQLIVGGKIISLFINPIMWGITICYFLFRADIGGFIETFFPDPILYMGVFSLIVGNFLYLYYYMVGCVKRGHDSLIKYVFFVPFYWLAISAAAWRGVYEIIVKPHYWAKTVHGLHLTSTGGTAPAQAKSFNMATVIANQPPKISAHRAEALLTAQDAFVSEDPTPEPVSEAPEQNIVVSASVATDVDAVAELSSAQTEEHAETVRVEPELVQILEPETEGAKKRSVLMRGWDFATSSAGLLVLSTVAANFLNFVFNAYLGRHLNLEDFGIVTTVATFVYILNLFVSPIGTTVTHAVSYLEGRSEGKGARFFKSHLMIVLLPSIVTSALWILGVSFIASFLHIPGYLVIASFAPAIFAGMMKAYNTGYLQGTFSFGSLAFLATFEALSKLGLAVFFVQSGSEKFISLAVPASIVITWVLSTVAVYYIYAKVPRISAEVEEEKKFPLEFFSASFMRGLSVAAFLSVDVLLAKHYLPSSDAGLYSMLSLLGKMIFFFGTLLNVFIVTLVSRAEGEGKDPRRQFSLILGGTLILTLGSGIGLSTFGSWVAPLLLGEEAALIVPYLWGYSAAMMLFTISTTIVLYRLAREQYVFPLLSLFAAAFFVLGIIQSHASIDMFIGVLLGVNFLYLLAVLLIHLYYTPLAYVARNVRDACAVLARLPEAKQPASGHKRILIFNWRDSESVYAGGAETYIHAIAERWVASGHAVTLFTSNDGTQEQNGFINGIRVIRRGGFFAVYALAPLYYLFKFRGNFDVIIDCENGIPFFMPLFAKEPVYCLLHHIHQEVFRSALAWPFSSFAAFLEGDLMPLVYRNSNFITVSESSKAQMEQLNITRKNIFVVYPGVDLSFLRPGVKSASPLVAYVGRLKYYKSVDVLIEAFVEVHARIPSAKLVIAGDGDDISRLKHFAQACELGDAVEFWGKITEAEKLQLMQEAWVVVNPSMMEGWGITTIEANACGTPVVAADVPGLHESVRHEETGLLVPYGDSTALTEEIMYLLSHTEVREQMEVHAQQWASNFDWEKSSKQFADVIIDDGSIPQYEVVSMRQT
jgi:glycosyltransferase involved in cell wall biosynthesis/O-antigen/teichoic acid export membrane protein